MNLRWVSIFIFLFLLSLQTYAQTYNPRIVCDLPSIVTESSGLLTVNSNRIWTHNDGGLAPDLYLIDSSGTIQRTIHVLNVINTDWEELCQDMAGNIYIGDFGNNANQRQDLKILKIPDPSTFTTDSIVAEHIYFSYPDQQQFPPPSSQRNFDCEAMFHFGDSLYLFSKNRGTSTYCKMYVLPDDSGTYVATLVDSFDTSLWITSADLSPDQGTMVLLSESRIHIFKNFPGTSFFNSQYTPLNITLTQKEGISFVDNDKVYLSDEVVFTFGGKLYELDIGSIISGITDAKGPTSSFLLFPNPVSDQLQIVFSTKTEQRLKCKLLNLAGQEMHYFEINANPPHTLHILDLQHLSPGIYSVAVDGLVSKFVLKQ